MTYVYGATTQGPAFQQLRAQIEELTQRLEDAHRERDSAQRSARKYKALFEKGNIETRNAITREIDQLHRRITDQQNYIDHLERERP